MADLITGYGVAESVRHFYNLYGGEVKGKRVVVQGWGNVGAAAAFYLSKQGAVITGVIDRAGGILRPEGWAWMRCASLVPRQRQATPSLPMNLLSFDAIVQAAIWDVGAEVFLPCAASRLVTEGPTGPHAQGRARSDFGGGQCALCGPRDFPWAHRRQGRPPLRRHSGLSSPIVAWRACSLT